MTEPTPSSSSSVVSYGATALAGALAGLLAGLVVAPEEVKRVEDLCAIEEPDLCESCGSTGEPACPTGDSGWLCCTPAGICVEALGDCPPGNIFGYCENYTTDQSGKATCHDGGK
jgi:hypothetical protein